MDPEAKCLRTTASWHFSFTTQNHRDNQEDGFMAPWNTFSRKSLLLCNCGHSWVTSSGRGIRMQSQALITHLLLLGVAGLCYLYTCYFAWARCHGKWFFRDKKYLALNRENLYMAASLHEVPSNCLPPPAPDTHQTC